MTLAGFRASNHPQQIARRGPDISIDDRATVAELFEPLHARFAFTIDVAADARNAKVSRFYDRHADGLAQPWTGERVWCNPPFSGVALWVRKAWVEHRRAELVVMLVPANRTEQSWWQQLVEPHRDRPGSPLTVEFMPGRPRFLAPNRSVIAANERPPFGCALLVWQHRHLDIPPSLFDGEDA